MENYKNITAQNNLPYVRLFIFSFFSVTFLVGAPGSILIIHSVLVRRSLQNPRNYFIVNLACSDITTLLTFFPFYTSNIAQFLPFMPQVLCKIGMTSSVVLVTVSVSTHVAIALERRRAIVFPLLPKPSSKKIKIIILIIWTVSIIVSSHTLYLGTVYDGNVCGWNLNLKTYAEFFFWFYGATRFLLPVGILTGSYWQIIHTLRKNKGQAEISLGNKAITRRFKNQRKAVRCLMALVSAFVLLNLPFNTGLVFFMRMTKFIDRITITYYLIITLCINFMVFALNPIILYLGSTEYHLAFNETFKQWMVFCCKMFSCCNENKYIKNRPMSAPVATLSFKITASKRDG